MLLATIGASLLENMVAGKRTTSINQGQGRHPSRKRNIQSGRKFLMWPNPLTNFEIQAFYQNKWNFNGVYSRNHLPKIKDGVNK